MTTTVTGEFSRIIVSNTEVRTPTDTPFSTIIIRDEGTRAEVEIRASIGGVVLPIPLPLARTPKVLTAQEPEKEIWTGKVHRRLTFVES